MIGIIADDLTGASDSGVQFARQGYNTFVVFHLEHLRSEVGAEVVVVDTDSRAIPAKSAHERVQHAAEKLQSLGVSHLYKKLDSTLRGNLGAEIDAVLDVFGFDFAIVAPAFPRIGRTTSEGIHYLNGIPIHQTEIARDPKCPVHESNLVKLLGNQSSRKVGHVPLSVTHEGARAINKKLQEFEEQGARLAVFDAIADEDLKKIVENLKDAPYRVLWVGSAGLADYIPLLLPKPMKGNDGFSIPRSDKPVVLVAGSLSKITKQQVESFNLQQTVQAIEYNPVSVLSTEDWEQENERCWDLLLKAVEQHKDISLYVGTSEEHLKLTQDPVLQKEWAPLEVSRRIAASLGELAAKLASKVPLQGLIMTGGDTAKAICEHMGVSGIQLLEEVEAGIPVSRLLGDKELLAVTKAGAFGNQNSLVHALHLLKGVSSNE